MNALKVALILAKKDLPVFRLMPRSKEPFPGSRGHKDATTDPTTLEEWFFESDSNIGLAPPPGYVVLDSDSREGEDALAKAFGGTIRPTLSWHTGRKEADGFRGVHRLYSVPEGVELTSRTLISGALDMKGGGTGYVVIPPSIHPDGRPYEFQPDVLRIAELSIEEAEAIARLGSPANGKPFGPAPPVPDRISIGSRNSTMTSLAGTLRNRNFLRRAALKALLEENQERFDPPLPEEEVEAVLDSVYRYSPGTYPGTATPQLLFHVDPDGAAQDAHFGESGNSPPFRTLGELRQNPDLLNRRPPTSRWLAWPGELTLLVGREKLGKSTLAAHDAVEAARDGQKVLWVTFEEGLGRVVSRFADLKAPDEAVVIVTQPVTSPEQLDEIVGEVRPDVVYVDSGASYVGATEGRIPKAAEGEEWQRIYLRLKALATKHQCGMVVLVHANKSDGKLRGSTGIGAAADTIFTMLPVSNPATSERKVEVVGRWERRILRLMLTDRDGQQRYEEDGREDPTDAFSIESLEDPQERIRVFLRGSPGALVGDIERLPGRKEIRTALRKMVEGKEVQVKTGRHGARHHYLIERDEALDQRGSGDAE